MTTTLSPFLILRISLLLRRGFLKHFRRERHDLHEPLAAQLARDRSEDARADRLELVVQKDGGVAVEADQRAVRATHALARAHDDGVVNLALLDLAARNRFAHGHLDDIADLRVTTLRTAEHLDAHQLACAAVV